MCKFSFQCANVKFYMKKLTFLLYPFVKITLVFSRAIHVYYQHLSISKLVQIVFIRYLLVSLILLLIWNFSALIALTLSLEKY